MGVFARSRVARPAVLVALASAISLWAPAASGADTKPAFTYGPVVVGDAFVGSTLAVAATWTGDPVPTVKYAWGRCPPTSNTCKKIDQADTAQYTVTAADLGYRLAVQIETQEQGGHDHGDHARRPPSSRRRRHRPASARLRLRLRLPRVPARRERPRSCPSPRCATTAASASKAPPRPPAPVPSGAHPRLLRAHRRAHHAAVGARAALGADHGAMHRQGVPRGVAVAAVGAGTTASLRALPPRRHAARGQCRAARADRQVHELPHSRPPQASPHRPLPDARSLEAHEVPRIVRATRPDRASLLAAIAIAAAIFTISFGFVADADRGAPTRAGTAARVDSRRDRPRAG